MSSNLVVLFSRLIGLVALIALTGCTGLPKNVEPVTEFELNRYLGQWHEIGRLDHSFERGLTRVVAEYSLREDGGVKVVNIGFDEAKQQWKQAVGKAYFIDDKTVGRLKVSFFGPFYGAYNIAKLAPDYSMVLVVGPTLEYGWILARTPQPDPAQCHRFLAEADRIGIPRQAWIWLASCD